MQTPKQKLDELLGISADQTIDDFLADLDADAGQVSAVLSSLDGEMKSAVQKVDASIAQLSANVGERDLMTVSQVEESLSELRSLIDTSKRVIQHVYESICTTDLVDSELIQAMAKLIEATHINIADYIDLYKQRVQYYDRVKLMAFDHQNRIQRMKLKHELDMQAAKTKNATDVPEGMVSFSYDDVSKMVKDAEEA